VANHRLHRAIARIIIAPAFAVIAMGMVTKGARLGRLPGLEGN
jgi:hypothetical protein